MYSIYFKIITYLYAPELGHNFSFYSINFFTVIKQQWQINTIISVKIIKQAMPTYEIAINVKIADSFNLSFYAVKILNTNYLFNKNQF